MSATSAWDVSFGVGLFTLAAAVAGVFVMGWLWRSRAPRSVRADAAAMDLRDETPAVVDLLTGGFDVDDDAVAATVIDLAARRLIEIDETGGRVRIRVRSTGDDAELEPYEQRVLRHIRQHAIDGVVPAEVLTLGPEGVSERWFRGFVREVNRHGQQLGLCRRRYDFRHIVGAWAIVVVAGAPAWLVATGAPRTSDPRGWGSLGNLFVGLGLLVGFGLAWLAQRLSRSNAQLDTEAGRAAAAHWLGVRARFDAAGSFAERSAAAVAIWDRHLAYATAMGLAPVAQRQLPFETEHDRRAWSRATGSWRRVTIRYQAMVPGWGQHPGRLAFEGLLQAAFSGMIAVGGMYVARAELGLDQLSDDQRRWVGLAGLVIGTMAALVAVYAAIRLLLGLSDLFAKRTIDGEIVRRRINRTGHRLPKVVQWAMWSGRDEHGMRRDHRRRTRHQLAIDEGDDHAVVAYVVRPEIYGAVSQGARVRAVVTPRIGYVRSIDVVAPARPSAAGAPTVHHELVEEATSTAGAALAGSMQRATETLMGAIDDDGRPLLDQVDDDGVTLREKLAESNDQLARVRRDTRIANSPIAGLLDAFASPAPPSDTPGDDGTAPTVDR